MIGFQNAKTNSHMSPLIEFIVVWIIVHLQDTAAAAAAAAQS